MTNQAVNPIIPITVIGGMIGLFYAIKYIASTMPPPQIPTPPLPIGPMPPFTPPIHELPILEPIIPVSFPRNANDNEFDVVVKYGVFPIMRGTQL